MFELMDAYSQNAVIKVIGVGGGGGNAVNHMLNASIEGVDFICANTDAQALKNSQVRTLLQLGSNITKGLGAGAIPMWGAMRLWRTGNASMRRCRAVTWSLLPPVWVAEPEPERRRWLPKWPVKWVFSRWQ